MAGVQSAREVALVTLSACEKQGAWSDLALKKNIREAGLDSRDGGAGHPALFRRASEQAAL